MNERELDRKSRDRATEVGVIGALLGISVIAILQIAQVRTLSAWLDFAVYAFAAAAALLASAAIIAMEAYDRDVDLQEGWLALPVVLGGLAAVAGLGACVAHHHLVAGILFWGVGAFCYVAVSRHLTRLRRESKDT